MRVLYSLLLCLTFSSQAMLKQDIQSKKNSSEAIISNLISQLQLAGEITFPNIFGSIDDAVMVVKAVIKQENIELSDKEKMIVCIKAICRMPDSELAHYFNGKSKNKSNVTIVSPAIEIPKRSINPTKSRSRSQELPMPSFRDFCGEKKQQTRHKKGIEPSWVISKKQPQHLASSCGGVFLLEYDDN
jgi:hypothetical protein